MSSLLLINAEIIVTKDDARRELKDHAVYIENNRIISIGFCAALPATATEVIDLKGHILLLGLINTHHHM